MRGGCGCGEFSDQAERLIVLRDVDESPGTVARIANLIRAQPPHCFVQA